MQKGISARDMSLSLGQSESYINKIENRHALPSLTGFFYICEYLDVTPTEFFDVESNSPNKDLAILKELKRLTPEQANHILLVVKDLCRC
jgi:transcriptional regulator with XRE-family HTH domain